MSKHFKYLPLIKAESAKKLVIRLMLVSTLLILALFCITSMSNGTIYDLFQDTASMMDDMNSKVIHFKVNEQDVNMFVSTKDDSGAMLLKIRNNKSLPFYRDKNGGLAVHMNKGLEKHTLNTFNGLLASIEPVMGFANGNSTKYVRLKLNNEFNASKFLDTGAHDSEELPVYPSAQRINTIQTKQFAIGHYRAQATPSAVMVYYDARLKSQGYKKLREAQGIGIYQSHSSMFIVNVEEESGYVSIITYTVKSK